ncbi:hypothetical protein MTsPCn9_28560 [Croceitalea sp. MTPC9]|nr:hypothetical protein MTsPCn6_30050 [Croceitalea sp. MTPC6]GMN17916.1 hypothetical protein MTsPCn9_28560 [Croceitalea sp. MTPC9]
MKTTLVFGASLKPNRYSNIAIHRLLENNIKTEAFGLKSGQVGSVQIKTNLDNFENIDTITLYMNPTRQSEYYYQIIKLEPKRVIFNPGTETQNFMNSLKKLKLKLRLPALWYYWQQGNINKRKVLVTILLAMHQIHFFYFETKPVSLQEIPLMFS